VASRRELATLALAVLVGGGAVLGAAGPAGADGARGSGALAFRATAEAAAVRMTMTVANGPGTNDPVDVPGPISHAAVNSLGSSSAFASFPYPGDAGVTVPGLLPAVVPGAPSMPPYPFYAKSEYPIVPKAGQAAGAVNLSAESTQTASKATGSAGPQGDGPGSMTSEASVAEVGESAVATSKAVVAAFAAEPLTLGRVVSTASVTLLADGTLQRTSALELSGVRIGDQTVGLSGNGFIVPGAGVPFPPGVQDQLRSALAGGGMTVEFLPERRTDDGVVSAGLRIRQERDMPNGHDALTWVIGQATASAVGGVSRDSGDDRTATAAGAPSASNGAGPEMAADMKEAEMKEVRRPWVS
jgi:hypothetical protein